MANYIKQCLYLEQQNLREQENVKHPHIYIFPYIPNPAYFCTRPLIPTNNHSKELPEIIKKFSNTELYSTY